MNPALNPIMQLNSATFQTEVVGDPTPILVDFWAPWCGPCLMMKPILKEAAAKLGGVSRVAQVNVDDHPTLAEPFGIRGIPTCVLIADGAVLDTITGLVPATTLVSRVTSAVQKHQAKAG